MFLISLKLILAPGFVALVSLAGRRWGLAVSGWISTFPNVAGPILYFFALEQGTAFASEAAKETLLGVVGFSFFALVYAWVSRRGGLAWAIPVAWIVFLLISLSLSHFPFALWAAMGLGVGSLWGARFFMPKRSTPKKISNSLEYLPWDLPLRMIATALLVLALTSVAGQLGPSASGALAPFPVASTVLVAFAHHRRGGEGAARLLSGSLMGMQAFCVFCAVLSLGLVPWGTGVTFVVALLACGLVQGLLYFLTRRIEAP